jgi:hypothetical protein
MKHHREDQHVIVGNLTAIGKRYITLRAGTQLLLSKTLALRLVPLELYVR